MWIYSQDRGRLYLNSTPIAFGYSGSGEGVNNPDLQHVVAVGPIPVGLYSIGVPRKSPLRGPYAIPLTPDPGNTMFGRSAFMIHGDSIKYAGQRKASHGCIILARSVREYIWDSGDHLLKVVRTLNA